MALADFVLEADRQLTICNACRYCEGYCGVFPAMELRTGFKKEDVLYIANLCHDCRACYYACMYIPPHEFAVNLPAVLSAVRTETYAEFARPQGLGAMVRRRRLGFALTTGSAAGLLLAAIFRFGRPEHLLTSHVGPGSLYDALPYVTMVTLFLALGVLAAATSSVSAVTFWREIRGSVEEAGWRSVYGALYAAATLRYLNDSGDGCYYPSADPAHARRWLHHLVAYGFVTEFIATCSAAVMQDLMGIEPPFPLASAPVILGIAGGFALVVGTTALLLLKHGSDRRPAYQPMLQSDYTLLLTLNVAAVTGFVTLALRETHVTSVVLAVHLMAVAAFFLAIPYGKLMHSFYRLVALVKSEAESRIP